jgi:restriction endonuclease S subunit
MKSYTIPVKSISKFSNTDFSLYSFSARDYRQLLLENTNTVKLKDLLEYKEKVGKEIGSEAYMNKSKYRFLKTVNISSNFLLDESSIEFCRPENKIFPKKNEILIAKDGGGNGLGEVSLYPHENKENIDSLSAGIIAIKVKEEKRNYVFGFLKSQHFKDFVDLNTAQGSTIRHSKLVALDYEIPFPTTKNNPNPEQVENLVSLIVQNIIDKEEQIKLKNKRIDELIEKELKENQKAGSFSYNYPRISEIVDREFRLDTRSFV